MEARFAPEWYPTPHTPEKPRLPPGDICDLGYMSWEGYSDALFIRLETELQINISRKHFDSIIATGTVGDFVRYLMSDERPLDMSQRPCVEQVMIELRDHVRKDAHPINGNVVYQWIIAGAGYWAV